MTRFCSIAFHFLLSSALLSFAPAAFAQQKMFFVVTQAATVAAAGTADVYVQCPSGYYAYGGGMDAGNATDIDMTSSAPTFDGAAQTLTYSVPDGTRTPPTGWHVSARNRSNAPVAIAAVAMCAYQFNGVVAVVATVNVAAGTPAAPSFDGVRVQCASPTLAMGGGLDTQFPGTMIVSSSSPVVDNKYLSTLPEGELAAPNGWSAFVRNEGPAGQVKAAVICFDLGGVITVNSPPTPVPPGETAAVYVRCPTGYALISGGFDSGNVLQQGGTYSIPYWANQPQFPVQRPDGVQPAPYGWTANTRNNGTTAETMRAAAVCVWKDAILDSPLFTTVYEFYNATLKHYFRTANAAEATAIDNGSAGPGWSRTGDDFIAYPSGGTLLGHDVCRFYTFGANSHFYTSEVPECIALQNPSSGWVFEGFSFRIVKPDFWTCPVATLPVYRLYNNRFAFNDSNHRFTTIQSNVPLLEAEGWQFEGVAFCAAAN